MSRKPASLKRRRALCLSAVLTVALLTGATTEDEARMAAARRKIQLMSQSELNQLKRNYEDYLKLSPQRRQQLFRLHDELEQDSRNGGHLQKLLDAYNRWFVKLSPFDREKVLSTADPGERAQLVEKLREEQKQRIKNARKPPFPLLAARFDDSAPLSSNDLDVVVAAVQEKFFSEETKKRVPETSAAPRDRHLQILRLAMEQLRRDREAGTKKGVREAPLVNAIVGSIPDESIRTRLQESGGPSQVRRQLGQLLGRSVLAEWKAELDESPPTPAQIDDVTNRWLASNPPIREATQNWLASPNGRRFAGIVAGLQTNPRLRKQRQVILWLFRGMPVPGTGRQGAGSLRRLPTGAEDKDKDSPSDQ